MPFKVHGVVSQPKFDGAGKLIGQKTYKRGHVVSDIVGDEIRAEHPGVVTRVPHDDDLCALIEGGCTHHEHPWVKAAALSVAAAPKPAPVEAPSTPAPAKDKAGAASGQGG